MPADPAQNLLQMPGHDPGTVATEGTAPTYTFDGNRAVGAALAHLGLRRPTAAADVHHLTGIPLENVTDLCNEIAQGANLKDVFSRARPTDRTQAAAMLAAVVLLCITGKTAY